MSAPTGKPGSSARTSARAAATEATGRARERRRRRGWESRHEPLLPLAQFRRRMVNSALLGGTVIGGSLALGVVGYHLSGPFGWLDALYNASMILGGMGPVDTRALAEQPAALKWFASFYALYAGVALLTSVGVIFAPVVHRVLHRFHLDHPDEVD